MRFPACLLLIMVTTSARGDDPTPPASPVRSLLDTATATVERGLAERGAAYGEIDEGPGTPSAKEARFDAAAGKYRATITPSIDALLDAVADHPADPATLEGLRFVLIQARPLTTTGQIDRAIEILRRDHVRSPNVATTTAALWVYHDKPAATALLRAVLAENPDPGERGRACYGLTALIKHRVESAERFRQRSPGAPFPSEWQGADLPALRAEAEGLYARCQAEYAAIPVGDVPGKTIGDYARGELAALRDLLPGRTAPAIVGMDLDGKPLRLGDYRGRVVVLIFAGEWCGPCRAAAPYFRDLLAPEAQQAAPCVVLEVNTDQTPNPVRAAIAAGEIAWPCWLDGGRRGRSPRPGGSRRSPRSSSSTPRASSVPATFGARTPPPPWPRVLADHPPGSKP